MNKTIYIRDEDAPTWDRAKELSGDKLSPVIVEALKRYVAETGLQAKGYERIVLRFDDAGRHGLPTAKAFFGRWIIPLNEPLRIMDEETGMAHEYSVAETAKGNVVVYMGSENEYGGTDYRLSVYATFEKAAADPMVNDAIRRAVSVKGAPVEELDI